MNRFLMSAAAVVLGLAVVGTAEAKNNKSGSNQNNHVRVRGVQFSHGLYFPGKNNYQWSYFCWSPRYNCNYYWCPNTCCYYYWCAPRSCYYPISYITYAPPVAEAKATVNVSQVVNVQNGAGGAAVPVVPAAPVGAGPVQPYTPSGQ